MAAARRVDRRERDDLRRQRHLTSSARAWIDSGFDTHEPLRGAWLAAATELADRSTFTATERDFIEASTRAAGEEQRRVVAANRRLRRLLVGTAAALVIAVVASAIAVVARNHANEQREPSRQGHRHLQCDSARRRARAAAASSPDLALLLGVEAQRRLDSRETRSALLECSPRILSWSPSSTASRLA